MPKSICRDFFMQVPFGELLHLVWTWVEFVVFLLVKKTAKAYVTLLKANQNDRKVSFNWTPLLCQFRFEFWNKNLVSMFDTMQLLVPQFISDLLLIWMFKSLFFRSFFLYRTLSTRCRNFHQLFTILSKTTVII